MQKTILLNNVNSKRMNNSKQNTGHSVTNKAGFSYSDVLREELSKVSEQRGRDNISSNNSNANSAATSNTSGYTLQILSSPLTSLTLGGCIRGDVNNDGKVNAKDVDAFKNYRVGLSNDINVQNADMDDDGNIGIVDFAMLLDTVLAREDGVRDLQGDINGDGQIDDRDQKSLQSYIDGSYSNEDFIKKNSDINGDDAVDEKDLQGLKNILDGRPHDWNESKLLAGDANGDGTVSIMDAMTVLNYVNSRIEKKDFYSDNADVNHDGKIDKEDAVRIQKFLQGKISSLDQKIYTVDSPFEQAVFTRDSAIYYDLYLTDQSYQIQAGQKVKVSGMSSDGTALAVNLQISEGMLTIGWVNIQDLEKYEPPVEPVEIIEPEPTPPVYQEADFFTSAREVKTYADSSLTYQINSYEKILAGRQFLILEETDNAYRVLYGTDEGNKDRWVSKDILIPIQPEPVPEPTPIPKPDIYTDKAGWTVHIPNQSYVYKDPSGVKNKPKSNEWIYAGATVTVLAETDQAYQVRYWSSVAKIYKERWIDKSDVSEPIPPQPQPTPQPEPVLEPTPIPEPVIYTNKEGWTVTALNQSYVYKDPLDVTKKPESSEWIYEGETVTILAETDQAYKISYWSSFANIYKERWIDKADVSEPVPPQPQPQPTPQPEPVPEPTPQDKIIYGPVIKDDREIDIKPKEEFAEDFHIGDNVILRGSDVSKLIEISNDASKTEKTVSDFLKVVIGSIKTAKDISEADLKDLGKLADATQILVDLFKIFSGDMDEKKRKEKLRDVVAKTENLMVHDESGLFAPINTFSATLLTTYGDYFDKRTLRLTPEGISKLTDGFLKLTGSMVKIIFDKSLVAHAIVSICMGAYKGGKQLGNSILKYKADGKFDLGDLARTAIDFSVALANESYGEFTHGASKAFLDQFLSKFSDTDDSTKAMSDSIKKMFGLDDVNTVSSFTGGGSGGGAW